MAKTKQGRSHGQGEKVKMIFTKQARCHIDKGKKKKSHKDEEKKVRRRLDKTGTVLKTTGTKKVGKRELKKMKEKKKIENMKRKVVTEEMERRMSQVKKKRKTVPVPKKKRKISKKTRKGSKPRRKPRRKHHKNRDTSTSSSTSSSSSSSSSDSSDSSDNDELPGSSHKGESLNLWEPSDMEVAILVGRENRKLPRKERVGIRAIAKSFDVPKSTLDKRIRGKVKGIHHMSGGNLKPRLFTEKQELELVDFILNHADAGFPMTPPEVRELAHEYSVINRIKLYTNATERLSYSWQRRFMKRHKEISVKTPQDLSTYRASCSNKESVKNWFQILKATMTSYGIKSGLSVWNVDETGCISKPKPRKIFGRKKGKSNQIASCERGITTTAIIMSNAIGMKVPPMVIFKGKRVKDVWKVNKTPNTLLRASPSGWVEKKLFHQFAITFLQYLKDHGLWDMPHIILLDGHKSHTYNYRFLYEMYRYNICVMTLPPHCSHFLQPLDGPPLANFKNTWKAEMYHHIRRNAGAPLKKTEFFIPFNRSFRAMTVACIQQGFKQTGIWPLDFKAIKEEHFAPSSVLCPTDRKLPWCGLHFMFYQLRFLFLCENALVLPRQKRFLNRDTNS